MQPVVRVFLLALMAGAGFAPASSNAQILDRLKKRAADAVEKKVEDKAAAKLDQMAQRLVDNSFAALFGDDSAAAPGAADRPAGAAPGRARMPFSPGSNAKTEDRYTFSIVTTMEVETFRRGDKSDGKAILRFHFNPDAQYMGTSVEAANGKKADGAAFVVMDARNAAMVMLMESDKSKFSIAYDWKGALQAAQAAQAAATDPVNWDTVTVWRAYSRIGTKNIAGYAAHGYRAESPDGTVEIWVTRDAALAELNHWTAGSSLRPIKGKVPAEHPYGMLLEMSSTHRGSGERVTMRVTDIDARARVSYAMSDYPRMEMGGK